MTQTLYAHMNKIKIKKKERMIGINIVRVHCVCVYLSIYLSIYIYENIMMKPII
jgi:hypothetical protein